MIIKPFAVETSCNTTPNAYANAALVRLWNSNVTTAYLVTRAYANNTVIGTITIGPNMELHIEKRPTEVLTTNNVATAVFAAPIGFESGN